MTDDPFAEFINNLEFSLPNNGLIAPELEDIEDDTEELNGSVIQITFTLNLFMNHREDRYFMLTTNQKMQNLGKMSLKEAILKFNPKSKRKKK